jgi:hypothetical protein
VPNFRLNQPITFKEGTGLTIDQNGIELYVRDHTGVVFSIGQAVGSGSNVQFNEVTSSKIIIDDGSLILSSDTITGSFTQTGDISVSDNLVISKDLTIEGILTAGKIETELSQSATLFESGSTLFGDGIDDEQYMTGSMLLTSSLSINGYEITEISNDTSLTDGSSTAVLTENSVKQFYAPLFVKSAYLRKSFAHTGSFVSVSTASFTAATASAPSGLTSTSKQDFIFFLNGTIMENDSVTIEQDDTSLLLKVNNDTIGYNLENTDEIVAFGKFNS